MTFKETLEYLYKQLPMFHRIGAAAYKASLDNTHAIMDLLHHPYNNFKSIHIAGTNGKGSVSHMLASVLQHAGYKTGLYTSPHLKDFRERIRVNGKMIAKKNVVDFVERYKTGFEKIQPSFFEWTVGLAFDYFKNQRVDVAVIETGLGGRLDSTNVITPLLSVITNISYDHINLLGDSLQKIAFEKAGIIKENIPVVIGQSDAEINFIFKNTAKEKHADIYFADNTYMAKVNKSFTPTDQYLSISVIKNSKVIYQNLKLDLTGSYQQKNVLTVMGSVELLREHFSINKKSIYEGLENVKSATGLRGRWDVLSKHPLVICDTGHNEEGIREVVKNIKNTVYKNLHFVLGMVNDKDAEKILAMLPVKATYYFCKADIPRGLDAMQLKNQAQHFNLKGDYYSSVKKALRVAKKKAQPADLIFIGGSTFVVAEMI